MVNKAVFGALDRFDEELSGHSHDPAIREAVNRVFSDFSVMKERGVREKIAGNKTGPFGTAGVDFLGYINYLKDCDAGVQWALFMPDVVRKQQKGFKVASFAYKKCPPCALLDGKTAIWLTSRPTWIFSVRLTS